MKDSSQKRKIFTIIILLLIVFALNFFQKGAREFFYSISFPIQKTFWRTGGGAADFFEAIFQSQNLKKENEGLKLEIQELLSSQNYLKDLEEENKSLREALGLGLKDEYRLELAQVFGKDANKDSILIDKGSKNGISEGFFVITSQKVLVGKIREVYQNYSRVLLVSDKESSFEAKISGSNASGLAKGLGGSEVFLSLIPKDKEIKEGDLVVSGEFSIGLVKEVKKIDVNPFQEAEISAFLNVSDLNKVFIVLD